MHSQGFPPVARSDARVLILGSLPGRVSLEAREYYAHGRNAFWRIMGDLFGFDPKAPYADRLARLTENRVALWDVCASAERPGSLDSRIKGEILNDFKKFFAAHRGLEQICFNGKTAERLYFQLALPTTASTVCLPSSSPAHAALNFEQKLSQWRDALAGFLPARA
jgi:double-stranded uracil-DNA glycosylase